ncbi:MAG TPA: LysM peptidoglycan-binding domain-containing protein [Turneriella sp.]|nr:LysM peptidoglycan-binding domain-containing protein [Turneriella sp.]
MKLKFLIVFLFAVSFLAAEKTTKTSTDKTSEEEQLQIVEVKRGDTLAKISKKYLEDPSQWPALLKYNKIANPNLIQPGMKLKVPASLSKKPAAVVIYKSGSAQYTRAQERVWKEVLLKLGLYPEDQVKTGAHSLVHLQLTNQAILRIQPQSFVIVNKVGKSNKELIFTLQNGRLQAQAGNMHSLGGRLAIRTPVAVASVRGTIFELTSTENDTGLACHEGQVAVSAQKVTVEVPAGMGTYVEKGKAPMKPFKLPLPPQVKPAET